MTTALGRTADPRSIGRLALVAILSFAHAFAWARTERPESAVAHEAITTCEYLSAEQIVRILRAGESFAETRYAYDLSGRVRDIAVVASCRASKQGAAIGVATTLDGQPVAVYDLKRTAKPMALRAGEFVSDALWAYSVDKRVKDIPVTVSCRDRGGVLDLEMTAALDGQPMEFYTDEESHLYALKPGEEVVGTSKMTIKKSWAVP